MLALNENNQNVCIVKKLTDSSYVLEIKSSGSANGLDVGERKREKFSQVCSSSTGRWWCYLFWSGKWEGTGLWWKTFLMLQSRSKFTETYIEKPTRNPWKEHWVTYPAISKFFIYKPGILTSTTYTYFRQLW